MVDDIAPLCYQACMQLTVADGASADDIRIDVQAMLKLPLQAHGQDMMHLHVRTVIALCQEGLMLWMQLALIMGILQALTAQDA